MWDSSGRFEPAELRRAILLRGWTITEFAAASGLSLACVYAAVNGQRVRDKTAIRIFETLDRRPKRFGDAA